MFKTDIYLRISNQYKFELVAESALRQYAIYSGFKEDAIEDMELAIREGCINVVKHSKTTDNKIHLGFHFKDNKMKIIIKDKGKGFDVNKVKTPDIEKMVETHKKYKGGWGIMILKKYMDKVSVKSVINKGTTITMYKNLK